jgi:GNAT superfamily N-acetyltransferase
MNPSVPITRLPPDFRRWDELLALISDAFAYMDGVIDPPSSAKMLTEQSLAAKAGVEICFIAMQDGRLLGCIFAHERPDCLYIGKLAVTPSMQGSGLGRALVETAEAYARTAGKPALELEVRVELIRNQSAFARLGFRETGRTSHQGYDRPTSITMRKNL